MNPLPLHNEPWLLTPEAYHELLSMQTAASIAGGVPSTPPATPCQLTDGLATVQIRGTMMRTLTPRTRAFMAMFGLQATDMTELGTTLQKLQHDPSVNCVLLDIDSPGGTVNGTPELAAMVRTLSREKYVYAYTAGQCCSAAYWIASQCDGIYAAPSSRVGSIGVLLPVTDSSALYNKLGLKVEVFSAGKYKDAGVDGTSLTDEQRLYLQQQVETTWYEFKTAATRRRVIAPEDMEGQTFTGADARDRGMVDACASLLSALQDKLTARHCL